MRLFARISESVADAHFSRALVLAQRAQGATFPNPLVGCVIAHGDEVVGEGYHARAGEAHAEVMALAVAGERARGATAYVTLEPCAHHGRTGPCAEALVDSGVSRVVIGMRDPNPLASGGARRLQEAGIVVEFASDPVPFRLLNEGWAHRIETGYPLVTAKVGVSLDAHGALNAGERAAITGAAGSRVTRDLRTRADAVLVGGMTVIADDPALTVRDDAGTAAARQPIRVVLLGSRALPASARVLVDDAAPTVVLAADGLEVHGIPAHVEVVRYDPSGDRLGGALHALAQRGVGELLVEPGPRLLTALIESDHLDALVTVTAGGFAGSHAPPLYRGMPQVSGAELLHPLVPIEAGIVDDVSVTQWRPHGGASSRNHGGH